MTGGTLLKTLAVALVTWVKGNLPVLAGLMRALFAAAGGWLVSQGWVTAEETEAIGANLPGLIGSGLFAVSAVWSVVSKIRAKKGEVKNG